MSMVVKCQYFQWIVVYFTWLQMEDLKWSAWFVGSLCNFGAFSLLQAILYIKIIICICVPKKSIWVWNDIHKSNDNTFFVGRIIPLNHLKVPRSRLSFLSQWVQCNNRRPPPPPSVQQRARTRHMSIVSFSSNVAKEKLWNRWCFIS